MTQSAGGKRYGVVSVAAFAMTGLGVIGFQIMATHQVAHAVDRGFPQHTVVWFGSLPLAPGA